MAKYAGRPELPAAVEAAVRAQQSSDAAVAYGLGAARILERVVLGSSLAEVSGARRWGGVRRCAGLCWIATTAPDASNTALPESNVSRPPPLQAIDWAATAPEVPESVRPLVAASSAAAATATPFNELAAKFGVSCAMPGALQVALVAARRAEGFEAGVRANLLAGGDNCSRSCYLGALLGAGAGGVPAAWVAKVTGGKEFEAEAARVVA